MGFYGICMKIIIFQNIRIENRFLKKTIGFFVIFAVPSMVCYMLGSLLLNHFLLSVAIGITLYGFAYFVFHEVVFHRRLKWFKRWKTTYVRSVILAHSMHHQHHTPEDGECFGLLIFPFKYFKIEKEKSRNRNQSG